MSSSNAPSEHAGLNSEQVLLIIAGVFILVNFIALTVLTPSQLAQNSFTFGVWALCAGGGHFVLNHTLPHRDKLLFPVAMFLSGWGLVLITRLAPYFAQRQTFWLALSTGIMLVGAGLPHLLRWLREYRYLLLFGGLALLLSTMLFGSNPSGQVGAPQLWLRLGGLYIQPSELLKVVLVAFLASYLAEQYPLLQSQTFRQHSRIPAFSPRIVGPVLMMWGISVLILIWQRDLGTAMLFFVVFLILLYVTSGYTIVLVAGLLLVFLAGVIAYMRFPVVQLRIDIWINPWPEADGRAYQIVQSLQAFSAGGIFGQGIGQGLPTYIPVVHSDFIFAALAEEYGLLGVIAVLVSIAIIIARGIHIATFQQKRLFNMLLAVGLSTLIATQSIFIMGGVIRLLPLTGVTLPFMSYGGSSLVISFTILGLLLRLSATEG